MATAHRCTRSISSFVFGRETPSVLAVTMAALKHAGFVSLLLRSLSKCLSICSFLLSKVRHTCALSFPQSLPPLSHMAVPCSAHAAHAATALQVSAGRCSLSASKSKRAQAHMIARMQHEPFSGTGWRSKSNSKRTRISPTQTVHPRPCSFSRPASSLVEIRT